MSIQKKWCQWSVLFLFIFMPWVANALAPQWKMLPAESQLTFTGTQNGAPVTGQFKTFDASIFADLHTLKDSSIDIVVDIHSLSLSYGELKAMLITADWFNAALFPKAEFKATELTTLQNNTYQAKGTLTIRDKSVPTTLTFTVKALSPNKTAVSGSTVLKRSSFGVGQGEWTGTEEIKDEVTVNFTVVAVKSE